MLEMEAAAGDAPMVTSARHLYASMIPVPALQHIGFDAAACRPRRPAASEMGMRAAGYFTPGCRQILIAAGAFSPRRAC